MQPRQVHPVRSSNMSHGWIFASYNHFDGRFIVFAHFELAVPCQKHVE